VRRASKAGAVFEGRQRGNDSGLSRSQGNHQAQSVGTTTTPPFRGLRVELFISVNYLPV
jgi:hypothetical protein